MESRQLRYFLAVAEHGSFSAAAIKIGVAQPALSAQVAKLELELGCKLFVRHARGIQLTKPGECLRTHAEQITEGLENAFRETRAMGRSETKDCVIGLPPSAADLTVPLIERVSTMMPHVRVTILDAMGRTIREWLSQGRLDLAVVYKLPNESLSDAREFLVEGFYFATADHQASERRETVTLDHVFGSPLVVSTSGNAFRELLEDVARRQGRRLLVAAEIDSVNGQRDLVLSGAGAAVLPYGSMAGWPRERVAISRIDSPDLRAALLAVRGRRGLNLTDIARVEGIFLELIEERLQTGNWPGALRSPHQFVTLPS